MGYQISRIRNTVFLEKNRKTEKQAGAELCQAQINFQLAMKPK